MVNSGLVVIALAWLLQLILMVFKGKNIQPWFVLVYMVGLVLLIIDYLFCGAREMALLNGLVLLAAALVLWKAQAK